VRAIAKELFGLQTIFWNQDTSDWSLTTPGGTTAQAINASMTQWLNGPKHPGLMILEHELTNESVQAFMDAYPLMVSTGWDLKSATELNGTSVYLNSKDSNSSVERANGVLANQYLSLPPGLSSSSTSVSSSTPAQPSSTSSSNPGSNTSQSGNNGSVQSTISKLAGAVGAVFLTVVFYAW